MFVSGRSAFQHVYKKFISLRGSDYFRSLYHIADTKRIIPVLGSGKVSLGKWPYINKLSMLLVFGSWLHSPMFFVSKKLPSNQNYF